MDYDKTKRKISYTFFIKITNLQPTYPKFTGYLFNYWWNNHAGSATNCIHDTVKETSKIWREILIVRQIRDKSSTIETQCKEQKNVCKHKIATDIADQYQKNAWYKMCCKNEILITEMLTQISNMFYRVIKEFGHKKFCVHQIIVMYI